MHWHGLTKAQKEHIVESHIFVEKKQDGKIKARKVVGGNKQQHFIIKEDVSSPMVSAEAVMLTCVINALKDKDIAIIDIPSTFIQTVIEDEEHHVIVHIRESLVDSGEHSSGCLWPARVNQQGWPEVTASAVSECCLRNHGGSTIVLQDVCEESHGGGVQDQSV
jgi:hypothetical protein